MLSLFPELLFLSPFAATLLRIVAALVFLYAANEQMQRHDEFSTIQLPLFGSGSWIVWVSVVFHVAIGTLLFAGAYTQPAALLGAVAVAAGVLFARVYVRRIFAFGTLLLTAAILLSLLVTGPGALAFDLPL